MKLAELLKPGALRGVATATPATTATHTVGEAVSTVAKVATVAVATTDQAISDACRMAGLDPALMPEALRADLLKTEGCDLPYLTAVIRDDAEWFGWDGGVRLADYAPDGIYYRES